MFASKEELVFIVVIVATTFALLCAFFIIVMLNYVKVKTNENSVKLEAAFNAEENERKRISSELHDNIGLKLSVAKLQFELLANNNPGIIDTSISGVLDETIRDIRLISRTQSSVYILENGIVNELGILKDYLEQSGKYKVLFRINIDFQKLKDEFIIHLYRIIQEMINNTLKHANATRIILEVKENNNEMIINYSDNGSGAKPGSKAGSGVKNIETRVNLFKGKIETSRVNNSAFNFELTFYKKYITK